MPKTSADPSPSARPQPADLALSTPPRGLIFDLDGTLADTITDLAEGVNRTLAQYGFPVHGTQHYKIMVGDGFSNLMRRALPAEALADSRLFAEILEAARKSYASSYLVQTRPYPGMTETLEALSSLGIRLAVLSNKPHEMAKAMVSSLFPGIAFGEVRGHEPGRALKPDPGSALAICEASGIAPEFWALVGDSGVDMLTAKSAGMPGLGAAWGFRGEAELRAAEASIILDAPSSILDLYQQSSTH